MACFSRCFILIVLNGRPYFFTQVCTYWHYVPCWEQDCGNGRYCAPGDQPGKIHLRLYSGPLHPWRNHSAAHLFCIHTSKSIPFSLRTYHTVCHCLCHLLQVGFHASSGTIDQLCQWLQAGYILTPNCVEFGVKILLLGLQKEATEHRESHCCQQPIAQEVLIISC